MGVLNQYITRFCRISNSKKENQIPNSKPNAYGLRAYSLSSEKSNSKKEKQISKKIMFQIPKLTAENKKLRIFNFHFFRTGNLNIIS